MHDIGEVSLFGELCVIPGGRGSLFWESVLGVCALRERPPRTDLESVLGGGSTQSSLFWEQTPQTRPRLNDNYTDGRLTQHDE
jgi:hypothetical protein